MTTTRPMPVGDLDRHIFWLHARDHQITYETCITCSRITFYPRGHCTSCGARELHLEVSSGQGEIYSLTAIRSHPEPFFAARVPYVVAVVQLDEGFRMITEILGAPEDITIGQRVTVQWDDSHDVPIPLFVPAADGSTTTKEM